MKSKIHEIPEIRVNLCLPKGYPWLKNGKNRQISEKIRKSYTTFSENKPNFKTSKIGVSSFETSKYEIFTSCRGEKTNPIKANSKPILAQKSGWQSQFKPKQSQFKFILECRSRGANCRKAKIF